MNPDLLGLIVAAIIGCISALIIMIRDAKSRAERLQREKDVANIKTESKSEVDSTHLDTLVTKLNSRIANDKTRGQ